MSEPAGAPSTAASLRPRKRPSQPRSARTVDDILEGAARLLEEGGLEAFTTNEIADRAGVSVGSLYQYFPNKDAVIVALIERETAALVGEVAAAVRHDDPVRAIDTLVDVAVGHQLRRPRLARLLDFEESRLAAAMPPAGAAGAVHAAVSAFLTRAFGAGRQDADSAARDVLALTTALTDAAGRRGEVDAPRLQRRISGAISGYLGQAPFA